MYNFKKEDVFSFASFIGADVKQKGNNLMFKLCPYCHGGKNGKDKDTFAIDLKTGKFNCLRSSCGVTGNMITIHRDFNFSLGTMVDEYYKPKKKYATFKKPEKPIVPKKPAIDYLLERGISEEVAQKYQITVQTNNENILVFPFYDENGELCFIKYRKTDFNKDTDKCKEWCEKNGKPILFGMFQATNTDESVIITEGQMDTLAIATCGINNAVSVPTGAKGFTWLPYCWDWLTKFKEIIVFGDNENGEMTLLSELKNRFPTKIKHVRLSDYKNCKDANEILIKHGKEAVLECIKNAVGFPVRKVKKLSDVATINPYTIEKIKTGIEKLDQLLAGGLPYGMVHVLTGKRGDGKSTLASMFVRSALKQGITTFVYSGELRNDLFKAWLDLQIAGGRNVIESYNVFGKSYDLTQSITDKINEWYDDKIYIYDNTDVDDENEDLFATMKEVVQKYGCRFLLIDNLMTGITLNKSTEQSKYDKQSEFVEKLAKFAQKYNVAILLVAHRRKSVFGNSDTNDEVSGSADITNLAGTVISYDRDNELPESERKLILSKSRLIGNLCLQGLVMKYSENCKRVYNTLRELGDDTGFMEDVRTSPGDYEIPF